MIILHYDDAHMKLLILNTFGYVCLELVHNENIPKIKALNTHLCASELIEQLREFINTTVTNVIHAFTLLIHQSSHNLGNPMPAFF